jgi:threonine synthase
VSDPISALRCIACGNEEQVTTSRFYCSACGDLLSVEHDLDRLAARHPNLKETFEQRLQQMRPPYASGVWRYHELILPDLPAETIVSQPRGQHRAVPARRDRALRRPPHAWVKHEGENPTLSFKDRG